MESPLKSVPKTVVFQDDILITGCNTAEHLSNLEEVLRPFDKVGLRLKREKCVFIVSEVVFLSRRVTAAEIVSCDSKVEAIKNTHQTRKCVTIAFLFGFVQPFWQFLAVGEHSARTTASVTLKRENLGLEQGPRMMPSRKLKVYCVLTSCLFIMIHVSILYCRVMPEPLG